MSEALTPGSRNANRGVEVLFWSQEFDRGSSTSSPVHLTKAHSHGCGCSTLKPDKGASVVIIIVDRRTASRPVQALQDGLDQQSSALVPCFSEEACR